MPATRSPIRAWCSEAGSMGVVFYPVRIPADVAGRLRGEG